LKKNKFLGAATIVAAIPSLVFLLFFVIMYSPSIYHWLIWEKVIIIVFCTFGGIMLWKESILGYFFSIIGWGIIIFVNASILRAVFETSRLGPIAIIKNSWLNIFLVFAGIVIIFILVYNFLKSRNKGTTKWGIVD